MLELDKCKSGCYVNGKCFNSFLYADDLLLVSSSVTDLQILFNKCFLIFQDLDLQINFNKSNCLRIGNRCHSVCKQISANDQLLDWVNEAKYLGVVIKCGVSFTCNWQHARGNFYKSINGILGTLGSNPSVDVVLALTRAKCFPILTYGIAAMPLNAPDIRKFSYAYNSIFCKLFKTNDVEIIEQCQYYCSFWPFFAWYEYQRFGFLVSQCNKGLLAKCSVFNQDDFNELQHIVIKYNFSFNDSKQILSKKVWNYLKLNLI